LFSLKCKQTQATRQPRSSHSIKKGNN